MVIRNLYALPKEENRILFRKSVEFLQDCAARVEADSEKIVIEVQN